MIRDEPNWKLYKPAEIHRKFEEIGVRCELNFPQCTNGLNLTLAHSKKRRHIETNAEMFELIRACQSCHQLIEHLGNKNIISMEEIVKRVIEIRRFTIDLC